MRKDVDIVIADDAETVSAVRDLFIEYREWLGDVVCSSRLSEEISSLPSPYVAAEGGCLLAAVDAEGRAVGCVGVRSYEPGRCEIKRLYVRPLWRGTGVARRLAGAALDAARGLGYRESLLDTLPASMEGAVALYRSLGFEETAPFGGLSDDEGVDILFMRLEL